MFLPTSMVGKKIMMAITGQILGIFILFHISGNSTIFFHKLNAYGVALHSLPVVVWGGRIVIAATFIAHLWYGTSLKIENLKAKPQSYIVTHYRQATFAGRYQIWTGAVIIAFLAYHLLQFAFQVTNPAIAANSHPDALGRPDLFMMVARSFREVGITGVYAIALAALGLHLFHGIQSSFQSWGVTDDMTLPMVKKAGTAVSAVLFFWYLSIPVSILTGVLK